MKRYTYYIYLIQGIKIGCTTDLQKRMADQGFTEWEILWQAEGDYDFGWIAGEKEIELQKLYGYRVDTINYQVSRMNRPVWNDEKRHTFTKKDCVLGGMIGGKISGNKNVESGHWKSLKTKEHQKYASSKANNIKWLCPGPEKHISSTAHYKKWCIRRGRNPDEAIKLN